MAQTLKQKVTNLFDNYNNISQTTVEELMNYLFGGIIPATGGTITGDLNITGKLSTGFIYDQEAVPKLSANTNLRKLYEATGLVESIDYANWKLFDNVGALSVHYNEKHLDVGGGISVHWGDRYLKDNTNKFAMNWMNRVLLDITEGNSIDWDNRILFDENSADAISFSTALGRKLIQVSGDPIIEWDAGLGFFATPSVVQQNISAIPMVLLADVITVVESIRTALGTASGYGLVTVT